MSLQAGPIVMTEGVQGATVENLVTHYFDRAYLMFNLFVDDPRTCLHLSESVFRTLDLLGSSSERELYGLVVEFVRDLELRQVDLPDVSRDSLLCWLLKDSAQLGYAEIAELMSLGRQQVAEGIAEVRYALLG